MKENTWDKQNKKHESDTEATGNEQAGRLWDNKAWKTQASVLNSDKFIL